MEKHKGYYYLPGIDGVSGVLQALYTLDYYDPNAIEVQILDMDNKCAIEINRETSNPLCKGHLVEDECTDLPEDVDEDWWLL